MAATQIPGTQIKDSSVTEIDLSFSDVTTNNADTTKHGLMPKFPGTSNQHLSGLGTFVADYLANSPEVIQYRTYSTTGEIFTAIQSFIDYNILYIDYTGAATIDLTALGEPSQIVDKVHFIIIRNIGGSTVTVNLPVSNTTYRLVSCPITTFTLANNESKMITIVHIRSTAFPSGYVGKPIMGISVNQSSSLPTGTAGSTLKFNASSVLEATFADVYYNNIGASSGTITFDCVYYNYFDITCATPISVAISNLASNRYAVIYIKNTAAAPIAVSLPSGSIAASNSFNINSNLAREFSVIKVNNVLRWQVSGELNTI